MTKQERERQLTYRWIVAGAALLAVAAVSVWFIRRITPTKRHMEGAKYFETLEGEAAVVVNGELLEGKGRAGESGYYADYASVSQSINPSIYYEEEEALLLVAGRDSLTEMPLAGGETPGGEAVLDGELFISVPFLAGITDAEIRTYENPGRIVVDTEESWTEMTFLRDAPIRYRAGIKSPILKDCTEGSTVRVTDVHADGTEEENKVKKWTHVVTEDGFAGYVEDRFLTSPEERSRERAQEDAGESHMRLDEPVHLLFHQTTDQASNNALAESLASVSGINAIAPTWFFLDGTDGSVTSLASRSYVETAHENGLKVFAVLNDFDGGIASAADTAAVLSSYSSRKAVAEAVMAGLAESGADGLCLDLELIRKSSAAAYCELIRELSIHCRKRGLYLLVCTYVPVYTNYLNRAEQARVADYLIVMCYDEHTAGDDEAGPVSSLPFVKKGIRDTLAQVDKEQVIVALAFFTRLWQTDEKGTVSSESLGMRRSAARMEELQLIASRDEESGLLYAEKESGGVRWQIWAEDAESLAEKTRFAMAEGCAGIAEWKMGLEMSDVWPALSDALHTQHTQGEE